jgi:hypothetical protein
MGIAQAQRDRMPLFWRFTLGWAIAAGVVGGVIGLIVGLRTYIRTAPFAVVELGLPAFVVGGIVGALIGGAVVAVRKLAHR